MIKHPRAATFAAAFLASASAASLAHAQAPAQTPTQTRSQTPTQPTAADAENASGTTLSEVVVTAGRRDSFDYDAVQAGAFRNARVLDTPLTVAVVPQAVIEAQGAQGLYDALRNTAGVTRSQLAGGTYDNIAIRGILVENRGNYRLNGSLPVINLVEQALENKERIEVLKGVSGLYYGFVPPSGVINMTTERPRRNLFEVQVRGDDHGSYGANADISRRFGDRFGARVNLAAGHVENGVDNIEGERQFASLALDWNPLDRLSFRFDAELLHKDVSEVAAYALPAAVNNVIRLPSVPDTQRNLAGSWQRYNAQAANFLLRADYRFSDSWAATLEVGQARTFRERDFSQFQNYNLTTGAGTLRIFLNPGQTYRNRNVRAELAGVVATGPIRHELTFGYTSNERYQSGRANQTVDVAQNLFTPRRIDPIAITANLALNPSTIDDQGVYAVDHLRFGEQFQVYLGVRYSDYESTSLTTHYTARETSPLLAGIWQPRPWLSVYATYLRGLEEGGTAPANNVNAFEILPPAVSEQAEIGVKVEVRGLTAQLAYFDINRPSSFTNAQNRFVLDGESRYRGVEAFASGEITPEFSIVASALWLDAELTRASSAALLGRRPENTPEWTASLFGEFRPGDLPGLAVNAGVFAVGDRAVNPLNQAFVNGFLTTTMGVRYTTELAGGETTFRLNIDNASNARYYSAAGNGLLGVGQPRTVKFEITRALF